MTRCDHGVRFDRYCGDCEAGVTFGDDYTEESAPAGHRFAFVVLALVALIGGAAVRSLRR